MNNQNKIHSILKIILFSFYLAMFLGSSLLFAQETSPQEPATDPQQTGQVEANTPELNQTLLTAVGNGLEEEVIRLISQGADVNAKDEAGQTALHIAANNNNKEIIELLIDQGADLNASDNTGRTPLHYAMAGRHKDATAFLIIRGNWAGTFEEKELKKVRWLLSQGFDVDAELDKGNNDKTLLHFAAQTDYLHVAALLTGYGADVNARDSSGQTPIQIARRRNNSSLALLLTDAKPGAFLTDQDDMTQWINAKDVNGEGIENIGHDVSIINVTASSDCVQGDVVPITVTIENHGSYREVLDIALVDMGDESQLAVRAKTLGASFEGDIQDTPDLVFDPNTIKSQQFGTWVCIGGDVNGDGFVDALICAPGWENDRGRVNLYYGGKSMDAQADVVFIGESARHLLGNQSGAFSDLNNDGYDDVIIGAPGRTWNDTTDGYVNIYYGGPNMDNIADVILKGESGSKEHLGLMVATGDIDKDGFTDILAGAQGYDNLRGRVYLFWGGDPFDPMPDLVFEGEEENSLFGRRIDVGGDINGDNYVDILIGARQWGDNECGRAYLFLGNTREQIDTVCDYKFTGEGRSYNMGSSLDIFDIDNDGIDDVLVGARHAVNARGQVYIYWGAKDFDGSRPGVILDGQENSAMGGDMIECGHFNEDSYGDVLAGAWRYPDWIYDHGRSYIFYGNTKEMMDTTRDHIFSGEGGTMDMFGCQVSIGDVNNDGYIDALISAPYVNHGMGRACLYYGPFHDNTNITFNWDTTNASIGKHTLKVEIPPVPGEQNTEDNSKTVTVEVTEPTQ